MFAAHLSLWRLEIEVLDRIPGAHADRAVRRRRRPGRAYSERLAALGYLDVSLLEGGLKVGARAGGELFIDVNCPAKPLANWWKPSVIRRPCQPEGCPGVARREADVVILDARRFDEYQTMSIPAGDQHAGSRAGAAGP